MAISKAPAKKSAKKVVKKITKKPLKKAAKPAAKKVTKKAAKPAAKKVAKRAASKPVKKVVKALAKKAVKKATKKSSQAPKKAKVQTTLIQSSMPVLGQLAPDFALQSDSDGLVSLSKYRGKNIVLYFYPKDDTPGCTKEACSFKDHKSSIDELDAVVIGVSPDNVASHGKFRTKYGLDFILVADENHKVCQDYGVWVEKNMYGKKYMGVQRATFLIDRNGCVVYVWPKVSVDGHTEEVLAQLENFK